MKNLIELRQERAQTIEQMQATIEKAQNEKRDMTADEQTEWDARNAKIKLLDKQIETLETQEKYNAENVRRSQGTKSPETKLAEKFDLFRAIRNFNHLDGAEAEVVSEGIEEMKRSGVVPSVGAIVIPSSVIIGNLSKRAIGEIATSDGTPPIKTDAVDMLSIVRTPLVIDKLGCTIYPGLIGNLKVPKMGQLTATFVNEKATVDGAGTALDGDVLAPRRVGSADRYTKELFIQTSQAIQAQIMQDFVDAIWRAVQKDLLRQTAAAGTILSGKAITDTPAALDRAAILNMEKAIETEYEGMAYVCSKAQKALLKALIAGGSGSGKFEWEGNELNGYPAYATASLAASNGGSTNTAFDVIFGYWKAAIVGQWGGLELIVDPYTYAEFGEYKIVANGLFDTAIANALHFSVIRNATA